MHATIAKWKVFKLVLKLIVQSVSDYEHEGKSN